MEKKIGNNEVGNRKVLPFFKENFNFIIILPGFLGGIWQLLELSTLSISFVRFFSVTQLIADGLLMLIVLLSFILPLLMASLYDKFFFPPESNANPIKKKSLANNPESFFDRKPFSATIIFITIIFAANLFIAKFSVEDLPHLIYFTFIGSATILYIVLPYFKQRDTSKKRLKLAYLGSVFIFLTAFVFISLFCHHIHQLFLLPKNLINIEIIKNNLSVQRTNDKMEIVYANDKYIFVKITPKKEVILKNVQPEKYMIIPFEEMIKTYENIVSPNP